MNQYAQDLKTQIDKDRERRIKENEMNEKEKLMNIGGLQAYLDGQLEAPGKIVPGFQRNNNTSMQTYMRN